MFSRWLRGKSVAPDQGATPLTSENLPVLLYHVMRGEQEEAEALVKSSPGLLSLSGDLRDSAGREFKSITALQYAVWALDAHMWTMLLEHMSKAEATEQVRALEEQGTAHGHHFDFKPLLNAYEAYIRNYDGWNSGQREKHWCTQVGGAQRDLPDWVL